MIGRLWRRLHRLPRLVSYDDYLKLRHQLPAEQRRSERYRREITRLLIRHLIERRRHRHKVADRASLKALLPPEVLETWKAERKETP